MTLKVDAIFNLHTCNLLIVNHFFSSLLLLNLIHHWQIAFTSSPTCHDFYSRRFKSYFSKANTIYELCMLNNISTNYVLNTHEVIFLPSYCQFFVDSHRATYNTHSLPWMDAKSSYSVNPSSPSSENAVNDDAGEWWRRMKKRFTV